MPRATQPNATRALPDLVAQHLDWLRQRNYADSTVEGRVRWLNVFLAWCEASRIATADDLDRDVIEHYQIHLYRHRKADGDPLTIRTRYARMTAVRTKTLQA